MKDIFKGAIGEVMNIKNIFENAGIESFIINEMIAGIEPFLGGNMPVSLQINEKDFEKASKLIADYNSGELEI